MRKKSDAPKTIPNKWLGLLRALWIAIVLFCVGLMILGWQFNYRSSIGTCNDPVCQAADVESGDEIETFGSALQLSPAAGTALSMAIDVIAVLPYFVIGYILFSRRSDSPLIWLGAFSLPFFAGAVVSLAIPSLQTIPGWLGLSANVIDALAQITFPWFFLIFPDGRFAPTWMRWLLVGYSIATLSGFLPISGFQEFSDSVLIVTLFAVIGSQIYRYRKLSGPTEKQQIKWVVIGLTISLGGFLVIILGSSIFYGERDDLPPLVNGVLTIVVTALFALIPIWIGIAIMRYRLWDVEVIINRALIYGLLSAILAGIFAASIVIINSLAREMFGDEATTTAGVASALIAASIFQPLKGGIEKWINTRLYPDNINLNREFIEFSPEFRSSIRLKDLLRVVVQKMVGLVNAQHASILLLDRSGSFRRTESHPSKIQSQAILKPEKALRAELYKGKVVSKGSQQGLWVPLFVRRLRAHDVLGVLDIGPRKDKSGFSSDDKKALGNLGAEIGASIYAAQLREKGR